MFFLLLLLWFCSVKKKVLNAFHRYELFFSGNYKLSALCGFIFTAVKFRLSLMTIWFQRKEYNILIGLYSEDKILNHNSMGTSSKIASAFCNCIRTKRSRFQPKFKENELKSGSLTRQNRQAVR